ncbi:MAG: hypothetical protein HUJ73_00045 [Eubacterium sp.]|nr:hypothetical protein [Eubacterium sp.]
MKNKLRSWFMEEYSGMEDLLETEAKPDVSRVEKKASIREWEERFIASRRIQTSIQIRQKSFRVLYAICAIVGSVFFIFVLLYATSHLPMFGMDHPLAQEVANRYIEAGLEETGAVNIVAGMILDYRAFDTLGESHVLFTALLCSTILLRLDKKNSRKVREDYYKIRHDRYFGTEADVILQKVGFFLTPCILVFGIYILLNGHLGPGGGFSGGAVIGAALMILSASCGFSTTDRILTYKRLNILSFAALAFYSISKCFVFFIGMNGLENPIPKGIPGAIISAGLILPLNVAVGLVVACTMYGFYSLFRRGRIGSD